MNNKKGNKKVSTVYGASIHETLVGNLQEHLNTESDKETDSRQEESSEDYHERKQAYGTINEICIWYMQKEKAHFCSLRRAQIFVFVDITQVMMSHVNSYLQY